MDNRALRKQLMKLVAKSNLLTTKTWERSRKVTAEAARYENGTPIVDSRNGAMGVVVDGAITYSNGRVIAVGDRDWLYLDIAKPPKRWWEFWKRGRIGL